MIFLFKWGPLSRDLCLTSAPTCTHLPTFFSHRSMTITRYWGLIKVDEWHEQHFKEAINQQAQPHSSLQLSWQRPTPPFPIKWSQSHFNWRWGQTGEKEARKATLHLSIELVSHSNHKNIDHYKRVLCQAVKPTHSQVKATIPRQLQQIHGVIESREPMPSSHHSLSEKGETNRSTGHWLKTVHLKLFKNNFSQFLV